MSKGAEEAKQATSQSWPTQYDIHLTWTVPTGLDPADVTAYELQYRGQTTAGPGWLPMNGQNGIIPSNGLSSQSTDVLLGYGSSGQFRIVAGYADGTGTDWGYSAVVTNPLPPNEVMMGPPGISSTFISDSEIDLSWPTIEGLDSGPIVQFGTSAGPGGKGDSQPCGGVFTRSGGYSHLAVTGLTPGMLYYFAVSLVNQSDGITSVAYGSANATTSGAAKPDTPYGNGTTAPQARYIPALGGVQIYWFDAANNESGFDVQRSVDDVNFTTIQHTGTDENNYVDTSAQPDSVYYYRLCATAGADDSVKSDYTAAMAVNTPGVSIDVQSDQTDPAENPIIPLDDDPTDSGTADPNLVPVQVNVPLGADDYGTATLSWNPGVKLWSDANKTTLLGTGTGYGGYTMTWDVSQAPASRTFYAEGVGASSLWGDHVFTLNAALTLYNPASDPSTNPTTSPSIGSNSTVNGAELFYENKDVTGQSAGDILVGSGVSLDVVWAGPRNGSPSNDRYEWHIDESVAVGGYKQTTQMSTIFPLVINTRQVHFYWIAPGVQQVRCDASIDGHNFSLRTFFDVQAPSSSFSGVSSENDPPIAVHNGILEFGTPIPPDPLYHSGITWKASVTAPAGSTGQAKMVQLIEYSGQRNGAPQGNGIEHFDTSEYVLDLERQNPSTAVYNKIFRLVSGAETRLISDGFDLADSPSIGLWGSSTTAEVHFHAETFLMYRPDGDSVWVALKRMTWGWTAYAEKRNSSWQVVGAWNSNPVGSNFSMLPTWSDNFINQSGWKPGEL